MCSCLVLVVDLLGYGDLVLFDFVDYSGIFVVLVEGLCCIVGEWLVDCVGFLFGGVVFVYFVVVYFW